MYIRPPCLHGNGRVRLKFFLDIVFSSSWGRLFQAPPPSGRNVFPLSRFPAFPVSRFPTFPVPFPSYLINFPFSRFPAFPFSQFPICPIFLMSYARWQPRSHGTFRRAAMFRGNACARFPCLHWNGRAGSNVFSILCSLLYGDVSSELT